MDMKLILTVKTNKYLVNLASIGLWFETLLRPYNQVKFHSDNLGLYI